MISQNSLHQPLSFEEIREMLVKELRAEGLTATEQDTLMHEVGDALLQRVTFALLNLIPPENLVEIDDEDMDIHSPEKVAGFLQLIAMHVPNIQEVVTSEIKAGIAAYQAHIDKHLSSTS